MAVESMVADDRLACAASREQHIRNVVDSRTIGRIRNLQIELAGSRVVISGRASTYYSKQLATHAAIDAADQLLIQNDVIVGQR